MSHYDPWGNPTPNPGAKPRPKLQLPRVKGGALTGVLLALFALWLLTGIYMVDIGEVAVVRQFGRHTTVTGPGLHWRLPSPIQTHNIVDMELIRRAEIGFRSAESVGRNRAGIVPEESLMLTGDENIVHLQMVVQYQVKDPVAYLFNVREPMETLHAAAEVAVRSIVGIDPIDYAMGGEGRQEQQLRVREYLQHMLDLYGTGLRTTEVRFDVVDAPVQVRDAFHDVVRAWEERERKVNQAMAYQADVVPKARGEAQQILRQAEAFREQRVLRATGDADRFLQMLTEYKSAPDITRQRMYLETIERALKDSPKFIMSGDTAGVLPLLPLNSLTEGGR